eukprot:Transcript_23249.p1 GENE.Transcript_23249~~Transcript_23249.p1  ORF type:complete len:132 (+),score=27.85 Transcript_23249:45-398(+)
MVKVKVRASSKVPMDGATSEPRTASQLGPRHTNLAKSKFSTLHLKKRRPTRPVKAKGLKGARVRAEEAAVAAAAAVARDSQTAEKLRLLNKLLSRQKASGRTEAAAQTLEQIRSFST